MPLTHHPRALAAAVGAALLSTLAPLPPSASAATADRRDGSPSPSPVLRTVAALDGPRGVDALGRGRTLVAEADGSISLVVERRHRHSRVVELGSVPAGFLAPAVAATRQGVVWILTAGGEPGTGAATLYQWRRGYDAPVAVRDVAAYQATDPDPANLEGLPEESNPYGLAVLPDGSAVVADAAGNDVVRVGLDGTASTLARVMPRTVAVPEELPDTDPEGNPLPPAGTMIPSESVPTSVAVGRDGAVYVGELRGFPATPGTSQVWRIAPGAEDAVCDPENPYVGSCRLVADGLTSVVDLALDRRGVIYALALSKVSWLGLELGLPGAEVGALHAILRTRRGPRTVELVPGRLTTPGGVDAAGGALYLTGPIFGPGALMKLTWRH